MVRCTRYNIIMFAANLRAGQWFSPVSSTNKTAHYDITKIMLKVVLNIITPPQCQSLTNTIFLYSMLNYPLPSLSLLLLFWFQLQLVHHPPVKIKSKLNLTFDRKTKVSISPHSVIFRGRFKCNSPLKCRRIYVSRFLHKKNSTFKLP